MDREDMERVGKRYFTSKCSSLEDLENLRFYGFRGEAVASIASLATLVEIASRSGQSVKTFVKIFKDGKGMEVFESENSRPSAGTTVVICNFFYNMPVRRKRMDAVLECERIRQRVEAISLMHPSISFTLKNDCTGAMVVQLSKARNIYYRFVQIHGLTKAQKLREISMSHSQFEMSGYIGLEGHYNNSLQFLFVNSRLILKTRIHKLLNFLLKKMSSSSRQNGSPSYSAAIGSTKHRTGAELHGVYIINIKCHYSEYDVCLEPAKTLIEFKDWNGVLSCIEEGIKEYLTRENLVTELSPEDVHSYIHGNDFTEPMTSPKSVKDSMNLHTASTILSIPSESYNGMKLMSKAVHRDLAQDLDSAERVQVDDEYDKLDEDEKELRVTEDTRFEYKCYPFKTEIVLPFLPRSRAERVLSSGLDKTDGSEAAYSLSSMFSEWTNPVFVRPPEVAVDVTSGQAEGLAVKIHNILYPYRFTKDMIHSMKVVHQVDKKFLACLISTRDQMDTEKSDGNLLVLVDQHAAHERVRLESLVTESYEEDPESPGEKRLCSSCIIPPLEIEVTEEDLRLLRSCQPILRGHGLEIMFPETGDPRLLVGKVPVCFVEREANEIRRGRNSATKAIVELLRSAGRVRGTLPLTVLKVLASQACHGAIKFNHSLSLEECCSLVGSLSTCQLPFQCAHGRPSMVPLADLLHLDGDQQESPKPNLWKLRQMYLAWEHYGKK
ncbi:hypothetical protein JZ751_002813 [Albula glossodonta]|uniref:MutL homolog 3 n=1 Tax=Albula glossodonta TaxID=121402 RepID=A0A8T2N958_9TELE|nr:hypothetical protein JZ751_002813 [Albula glossodonta]